MSLAQTVQWELQLQLPPRHLCRQACRSGTQPVRRNTPECPHSQSWADCQGWQEGAPHRVRNINELQAHNHTGLEDGLGRLHKCAQHGVEWAPADDRTYVCVWPEVAGSSCAAGSRLCWAWHALQRLTVLLVHAAARVPSLLSASGKSEPRAPLRLARGCPGRLR